MSCPLVISKQSVRSLASWWLSNESLVNYVGTASKSGTGKLLVEMLTPGTFVGTPFVDAIVQELGCEIEWHLTEGQLVECVPSKVATISGTNQDLFFCENLVHVILTRASGITTFAARFKNFLPTSWSGTLSMPEHRTPGFCMVEEYALMLANVFQPRSVVRLNYSGLKTSGRADDVIRSVKSKIDSALLQVQCNDLQESLSAANAGADIVAFRSDLKKELGSISSRIKNVYPNIKVQVNGYIDETDAGMCATKCVDILSSLKFCNGYPLVDFQVTHMDIHTNNAGLLVDESQKNNEINAPPQSNLKSPISQPSEEVDSSTPVKKSRLNDDEANDSKLNKSNGTPDRISEPPVPDTNWSTLNTHTQTQKRQQRNPRYPQHMPRPHIRNQSPSGMQGIQLNNPRAMIPTTMGARPLGMLAQTNSNQMLSGMNQGVRLPMMSQQRMPNSSPNLLNTAQPMSGGFINNMQNPPQQPSWQMSPGGGQIGPVGMGVRMGTPPNMCRSCGAPNNQNMPFCRNCRAPIH